MPKKPLPNNPKFNPANYPYPYCREQHRWEFYDGAVDKKAKLGYRIQRCEVCEMKKNTVMDLDPYSDDYGRVVSRSYRQPAGYRVPGGIDWHDRALLVAQNFLGELAEVYEKDSKKESDTAKA